MAIGALSFLMGLSELRYSRLTASPLIPLLLLGGTASLLLAIHRLRTHPDPWLDLSAPEWSPLPVGHPASTASIT
ncbi:hypothetical protein ACU4HD_25300 [Cupriavidus basilensis]